MPLSTDQLRLFRGHPTASGPRDIDTLPPKGLRNDLTPSPGSGIPSGKPMVHFGLRGESDGPGIPGSSGAPIQPGVYEESEVNTPFSEGAELERERRATIQAWESGATGV